ncbi:hypothetical protein HDU91_000373, partial [Kappamyces sp. JEL0680]
MDAQSGVKKARFMDPAENSQEHAGVLITKDGDQVVAEQAVVIRSHEDPDWKEKQHLTWEEQISLRQLFQDFNKTE